MKKSHLFLVAFVLLALCGAGYAYISNIPQGSVSKNIDALLQRAEHGDVEDLYEIAVAYDKGRGVEQNDVKAFDYYKQAANNGLAKAQNTVGSFYELGRGVEKNIDLAVSWYKKAADQRYALAQLNLGVIEYRNQRYEEAHKWFEKAAAIGNAEAQSFLGRMYANGEGSELDPEKSFMWHQKAASKNDKISQFYLGRYYSHNNDYKNAFKWYKKSSDQGVPQSQSNLASLYEHGLGVDKDLLLAGTLYRKAADNGLTEARRYLKDTLDYCEGLVSPNTEKIKYCFIAAGAKYSTAQEKLVEAYLNGHGISKNIVEAHAWTYTFLSFDADNADFKKKTTDSLLRLIPLGKPDERDKAIIKERTKEYLTKYGR